MTFAHCAMRLRVRLVIIVVFYLQPRSGSKKQSTRRAWCVPHVSQFYSGNSVNIIMRIRLNNYLYCDVEYASSGMKF